MLWKWLSFSDVNSATLCAYVVLAKAVQNGIGGNGILDIQKKKKKGKKTGGGRKYPSDSHWLGDLCCQCVLSLLLSLHFPFFHLPFLLLLGSNFKQYDFLQTCYFKGNKSLRVSKCKGVYFPKKSKRTTQDKSSFVLIILHLVNA